MGKGTVAVKSSDFGFEATLFDYICSYSGHGISKIESLKEISLWTENLEAFCKEESKRAWESAVGMDASSYSGYRTMERTVGQELTNHLNRNGYNAIWIDEGKPGFLSDEKLEKNIPEGELSEYASILKLIVDGFPIPVTRDYDHIYNFKLNPKNKILASRFRNWVHEGNNWTSAQHFIDSLSLLVDEYEHSLRQHNIKSALGIVEQFVALDTAKVLAIFSSIGALWDGVNGSTLLAGTAISGKIGIEVVHYLVEKKSISRSGLGHEAAFLYEIRKNLS
jgi:hypothetical protein